MSGAGSISRGSRNITSEEDMKITIIIVRQVMSIDSCQLTNTTRNERFMINAKQNQMNYFDYVNL
jgi:hypothetical protein